jgi:hypothetical protein
LHKAPKNTKSKSTCSAAIDGVCQLGPRALAVNLMEALQLSVKAEGKQSHSRRAKAVFQRCCDAAK